MGHIVSEITGEAPKKKCHFGQLIELKLHTHNDLSLSSIYQSLYNSVLGLHSAFALRTQHQNINTISVKPISGIPHLFPSVVILDQYT